MKKYLQKGNNFIDAILDFELSKKLEYWFEKIEEHIKFLIKNKKILKGILSWFCFKLCKFENF